jgi:hypothetical protein
MSAYGTPSHGSSGGVTGRAKKVLGVALALFALVFVLKLTGPVFGVIDQLVGVVAQLLNAITQMLQGISAGMGHH